MLISYRILLIVTLSALQTRICIIRQVGKELVYLLSISTPQGSPDPAEAFQGKGLLNNACQMQSQQKSVENLVSFQEVRSLIGMAVASRNSLPGKQRSAKVVKGYSHRQRWMPSRWRKEPTTSCGAWRPRQRVGSRSHNRDYVLVRKTSNHILSHGLHPRTLLTRFEVSSTKLLMSTNGDWGSITLLYFRVTL